MSSSAYFTIWFSARRYSSKRAINRGPPAATVERVDITDESEIDNAELTSFEIRRSY